MDLKFERIWKAPNQDRLQCSARSRQRKGFHSVVAEANQGNCLTDYSLSDHLIFRESSWLFVIGCSNFFFSDRSAFIGTDWVRLQLTYIGYQGIRVTSV